jgi:hypothetical protein
MNWIVGTPEHVADQETAFRRVHGIDDEEGYDPPRGRRALPPPHGRVVRYAAIVEANDGRAAINIASVDRARHGESVPINGRSVVLDTRDAGELPGDFEPRGP